MDVDERLSKLERQQEKYDLLILALVRFAARTSKGRLILTGLGIPKDTWT
jgi:hypothetical protein